MAKKMNTAINPLIPFFQLLRLGLGTSSSIDLPASPEWKKIFDFARQQGLTAVMIDAFERLSTEQRPPKQMLLAWIGLFVAMEHNYAKYTSNIASLASFYARHGIKMLLFKGYACSLCWPVAAHRPTGDIDIYLFGKQQEADRLMAEELGIKVDFGYHKHSVFPFQGTEVENHAVFIDDVTHKSNIRFEKTLMTVLAEESCVESPIKNVFFPPATFNALFLLRHTGEHFASNEISLRHVIDVGTFFEHYHAQVDWKRVFEVFGRERMLDFFNGITTICVDYLGMDTSFFGSSDGLYSFQRDSMLARHILHDIFEQKQVLPMSTRGLDTMAKKLKYSVDKSLRWWHNRWKYRLVYNENLFESFWWLAKNRIKDIH